MASADGEEARLWLSMLIHDEEEDMRRHGTARDHLTGLSALAPHAGGRTPFG